MLDSGSSDCHWQPPQATTGDASGVTASGAGVAGTVDPKGDATTYRFEWGTTASYGKRLADVLRHGVRLTLRCSRKCTVRVTLFLAGLSKAARRSAGTAVVSVAGHTSVVRVRLNAAARRRLAHVTGGRISIRLDASSDGQRAHTAGAVRLRR